MQGGGGLYNEVREGNTAGHFIELSTKPGEDIGSPRLWETPGSRGNVSRGAKGVPTLCSQSRSSKARRRSPPSRARQGPALPTRARVAPPHPRGGSSKCRVLPSPPETQSVLCLSADSRLGPTNLCVCPVLPGRSRLPATQRRLEAPSCRPRSATGTPPAPARPVQAPGQKPPPPAPARPHLLESTVHSWDRVDRPASHKPSESCPLALPPHLQKRRSSETRLGDAGDWPGTRAEVPRSPPPPRGAFQTPDCRPPAADPAHYLRPARQPAPLPRAAPTRRRRHRRRDSTAFDVPLGVGRDRTERQTQQPNRHRFYLAPPALSSAAPIGG